MTSPDTARTARPATGRRLAVFLSPVGLYARERLLLAIAAQLVARGYAVDVLTPGAGPELRQALPAGARLVDLARGWMGRGAPGARSKRRVYLGLAPLTGYLRRARPEVLLSGSIPPNLVALLARRLAAVPTRVVLRQSNVVAIPGDPDYGGVRPRPRDRLLRWLYPRADAVIANSAGVADNLYRLTDLPRERVRTILGGVDLATLRRKATAPSPHPWLDAPGRPVLLTVGRLVAKKDQVTLLRALATLRRTRDVRLLLVGPDGDARPEVEAAIAELGLADSVVLTGHSDNPYAYMARADAFVLSSVSEGMPNVLLEALACGCPVVSTDCPSGPRELLDGGRYGRLVPMQDPEALAQAIAATLDAPPDPDDLRARAAAFSVERVAARYVEVLEGLLPAPTTVEAPAMVESVHAPEKAGEAPRG